MEVQALYSRHVVQGNNESQQIQVDENKETEAEVTTCSQLTAYFLPPCQAAR